MPESEPSPISDETIEAIEGQVKKGKARKFFLVYKGASIKTLVVFKKGPFGPKILQAKKDGFKGEVCCGVVTGSGKNLFFQLAGNGDVASVMGLESWEEKPPLKTAKLKEFLGGCGLSFKPEFNILTNVSDTPDPESESDAPVAPPPPGSGFVDDDEGGIPESAPPLTLEGKNEDPAIAFKTRLTNLLPAIKQAVGTTVGDEAKLKASEAGVFARKQEFDIANELLDAVESLLSQAKSNPSSAISNESTALATKLAEALKKLKPLIDRVIGVHPERKGELYTTISQIAGEIKDKQFDLAKQNVTDFATLLKSLVSQTETAPKSEGSGELSLFASRQKEIEPRLLEAQRTDREKATKLGAVWDYALEQAQAGNLNNAFNAFDKLEQAIAEVLKTPGGASDKQDDSPIQTNEPAIEQVRAIFGRHLAEIEPKYLAATKMFQQHRSDFQAALGYAQGQAEKGELESALRSLDRLNKLIDDAFETEENESSQFANATQRALGRGQIRFRGAAIIWAGAKDRAGDDIEKLRAAVLEKYPEAENAVSQLDEIMEELRLGLGSLLNAGSLAKDLNELQRATYDALRVIERYQSMVDQSELINHIDSNPFVDVAIGPTLAGALDNLERQLSSLELSESV